MVRAGVGIRKRILTGLCAAALATAFAIPARAAEKPLTSDDVILMLLAGASSDKMLAIIEQRGIDFRMNPDLAQKFHNAGADDLVIEALQKAVVKPSAAAPEALKPLPPAAPPAPAPASAAAQPSPSEPADKTGPPAKASAPTGTSKAKLPPLADPSPAEIQNIIQEFAAKEKIFKEARATYTYHQLNKVSEYDSEGNPGGKFEQEWDIVFEDSGKRIERVTYAPPDTLRMIGMTKEDLESFRSIQPFVLTSDELGEYDVKYLGHVRVDEITAYVFDVRPKELKKGRVYFQGRIWVDDRDLQIVKSEGKTVPQVTEGSRQNLFPRFTTYREQIDGKFWFPTYTIADDTLYFSQGSVKVKQVIRYTDYRQFKSRVRILSTEEVGAPETPTPPPSQPATKAPTKKKQ